MVKGYSVFNCYYNNQEMTKQNLVNGWVRSGDLAIMENDGYVRIIGHKKNVIIRAGENIYSEDIEVVLAGEPDFKELKAVGVPDEIFGEEVALYYVPAHSDVDLNLPALAERLASRLKRYQLPRYIIRVAEIPRTFNGKIQSFKLREDFLRLEPQELQKIEIKYEQPPH
jgi:fatty-acyl-CoA synthase